MHYGEDVVPFYALFKELIKFLVHLFTLERLPGPGKMSKERNDYSVNASSVQKA